MRYQKLLVDEMMSTLSSETEAREFFWRAKYDGHAFVCRRCKHESFYELASRPEVRICRQCDCHNRLRAQTVFEGTSTPILTILRMAFLATQDKRGVSAWAAKRQLEISSYGTAWSLLQKFRSALQHRDDQYQLSGTLELDGAEFKNHANRGREASTRALVAVETKEWVDDRGRTKTKAGFAKIQVAGSESAYNLAHFTNAAVIPKSELHTDGNPAFKMLPNVKVTTIAMKGNKLLLDRWLPWVHKVIANAKTWILLRHPSWHRCGVPGQVLV